MSALEALAKEVSKSGKTGCRGWGIAPPRIEAGLIASPRKRSPTFSSTPKPGKRACGWKLSRSRFALHPG
jgi:hypothetical protein